MEISMTNLALMTLYSFVIGLGLGAVYDIIRIQRIILGVDYGGKTVKMLKEVKLPLLDRAKIKEKNGKALAKTLVNVIIFIQDILFCIFCALTFIVLIYYMNDGQIRWIAFFGMAVGFAVYYFTFGKLVMLCSEYIVFAVKTVVRYAIFFVSVPIKFIFSNVKKSAAFVFGKVSLLHLKCKVKRFTESEIKKLKKESENGFIGV